MHKYLEALINIVFYVPLGLMVSQFVGLLLHDNGGGALVTTYENGKTMYRPRPLVRLVLVAAALVLVPPTVGVWSIAIPAMAFLFSGLVDSVAPLRAIERVLAGDGFDVFVSVAWVVTTVVARMVR